MFDHDLPNVRSKCIFAMIYKAKKHLDQGKADKRERERERERERNLPLVESSLD